MPRFLLLVIALILYSSLYPFHFEAGQRADEPLETILQGWPSGWSRWVLRDITVNIAFYAPLGLAAAMTLMRRYSRTISVWAAIAGGLALSASMELAQVYIPMRSPNALDIVTNTVGAALGAAVAVSAQRRIRAATEAAEGGWRTAGTILLLLWGLHEFFPLFPEISRGHVYDGLRALLHTGRPPLVETWVNAAEWFAVGLALESVFARMRTWWLALAMVAAMAAQLAVVERNLTLSEAVAAAVVLAAWHLSRRMKRAKICAWWLGSAILLRELRPFYFLAIPQTFRWVPFAASLEAGRDAATVVLARKAFDYGAMIFTLRLTGWSYWRAGIALAAALTATAAIQTYLPGRVPEITDALLTLLMMLVLQKAGKGK